MVSWLKIPVFLNADNRRAGNDQVSILTIPRGEITRRRDCPAHSVVPERESAVGEKKDSLI